MTSKKPFPWTIVSIGITAFVLISGNIANFAVQGEKVKQLEEKQKSVSVELSLNSTEHKAIMQGIAAIDKTMGEIKTKMDICMPMPQRYGFARRERDTTR